MLEEMDINTSKMITIYVRLLNEGTEVCRPTKALELGDGRYKLLPTSGYDPEDEKWEFPPGSVVRGEQRHDDKSSYLVAVKS